MSPDVGEDEELYLLTVPFLVGTTWNHTETVLKWSGLEWTYSESLSISSSFPLCPSPSPSPHTLSVFNHSISPFLSFVCIWLVIHLSFRQAWISLSGRFLWIPQPSITHPPRPPTPPVGDPLPAVSMVTSLLIVCSELWLQFWLGWKMKTCGVFPALSFCDAAGWVSTRLFRQETLFKPYDTVQKCI